MKLLIVIDMQNDFIDGSLGTKEAVAIVPNVAKKIASARAAGETVIFTRDTHQKCYLETQEGKNLPVLHCIEGSEGWQISSKLEVGDSRIFNKPSFGSMELADYVATLGNLEEIELVGLCTGICVISNAFILKAKLPEIKITVDASCCACVSSMMIPFCKLPVFTPIGAKKVLSIVFTQSGADFIELATASENPFLAISDSRFDRITF